MLYSTVLLRSVWLNFNFALDPETSKVTLVHPPAMHIIFETNPFAAQRWADGYYSRIDSSSAEVAPFVSKSIRTEKSDANVSEPQPVVLEKQNNKRSACQTQEDVTNAQKKSRTSRTSGPFKCTVQADPPAPRSQNGAGTHPVRARLTRSLRWRSLWRQLSQLLLHL